MNLTQGSTTATTARSGATLSAGHAADSVARAHVDSVAAVARDSVWQADSLNVIGSRSGYVFTMPPKAQAEARPEMTTGQSWLIFGLIIVFVAVCLRVKSNAKYLRTLLRDITDVRDRGNAFDDTVRETSLLVMLSALWSCSAGVLLYYALTWYAGGFSPGESFGLPALQTKPAASMGICVGVCAAYTLAMTAVYYIVGNVFSDAAHTRAWVKGYLAEQGISSIGMLPLALLAICYPGWIWTLLIVAGIVFAIGKFVFIIKGFRIFFTQISSWVLFLYYLCSLEIVPLVITFVLAMQIISIM